MVIFHSYVSLPEDNPILRRFFKYTQGTPKMKRSSTFSGFILGYFGLLIMAVALSKHQAEAFCPSKCRGWAAQMSLDLLMM